MTINCLSDVEIIETFQKRNSLMPIMYCTCCGAETDSQRIPKYYLLEMSAQDENQRQIIVALSLSHTFGLSLCLYLWMKLTFAGSSGAVTIIHLENTIPKPYRQPTADTHPQFSSGIVSKWSKNAFDFAESCSFSTVLTCVK